MGKLDIIEENISKLEDSVVEVNQSNEKKKEF